MESGRRDEASADRTITGPINLRLEGSNRDYWRASSVASGRQVPGLAILWGKEREDQVPSGSMVCRRIRVDRYATPAPCYSSPPVAPEAKMPVNGIFLTMPGLLRSRSERGRLFRSRSVLAFSARARLLHPRGAPRIAGKRLCTWGRA